MNPRSIALACAAAAIAVSGIAVATSIEPVDWRVSALVHMSETEPLAPVARASDPKFVFVNQEAHYDGVYFYAMARDPFARGHEHTLIDRPAYRYGHVGYGWLASVASFGRAKAVPAALLMLGLVGIGVAGFAGSLLAREFGWSGWWGLVVAGSPGLIFAVTANTSEPVAAAFLTLGLLAWAQKRWRFAALWFAAMCLTKEPLLVVPVGLAVWELVEHARGRAREGSLERVALLAIGPVLFLAWYAYLRVTFGVWPFQQEAQDFLTFPFAGWIDSMRRAGELARGSFQASQVGNAAVALLAVWGLVLIIGFVRARKFEAFIHPVFILMALVIVSLNWLGLQYPKDLIRESAMTLLVLPLAIAGRRAAPDGSDSELPVSA
jgi:hypothetical protein